VRRVAITGLGCITPVGIGTRATWSALLDGRSGVTRVKMFEEARLRSQIGALVHDFDPEKAGAQQDMRKLARGSQLALAAAIEAWRDAGLDRMAPDRDRAGAVVGTGVGDPEETARTAVALHERGVRGVHPLYVARVMLNAAPAHISLEFGLRGPTFTVCTACAAGAHAIGLAMRSIRYGEADVMVAGGEEQIGHVLRQVAFDVVRALSTRNDAPEKASRPFDRRRDGFVMGEGAAMLVLEELERARRRGARIYAELAGFGQASDAHHMTAPEPHGAGAVLAMRAALADAQMQPENVQYVNAHGTSTPLNDTTETIAINRVFGTYAKKLAVSSTKSMIGHSIGAAAAIGAVAATLSIADGRVHPTINHEEPDPECDLDYVPNRAREMQVDGAIVNAFAFGGHCATLVLRRV
jgi:3-oxoacyl-[acyl-carrier-protein] synthase II